MRDETIENLRMRTAIVDPGRRPGLELFEAGIDPVLVAMERRMNRVDQLRKRWRRQGVDQPLEPIGSRIANQDFLRAPGPASGGVEELESRFLEQFTSLHERPIAFGLTEVAGNEPFGTWNRRPTIRRLIAPDWVVWPESSKQVGGDRHSVLETRVWAAKHVHRPSKLARSQPSSPRRECDVENPAVVECGGQVSQDAYGIVRLCENLAADDEVERPPTRRKHCIEIVLTELDALRDLAGSLSPLSRNRQTSSGDTSTPTTLAEPAFSRARPERRESPVPHPASSGIFSPSPRRR